MTKLRCVWPLIAILTGSIALKVVLLALDAAPFNADEAVVALMARHILQGERPWFFYGQAYMGSLDAYLVARNVADQIERRVSFRRAIKMSAERCMRAWAEGVKIMVSGRLGGRDMSRSEFEIRGRVPLQTLDADIDYGQATARTTYGSIGVKAWVHRGSGREEDSSGDGRQPRELPQGVER